MPKQLSNKTNITPKTTLNSRLEDLGISEIHKVIKKHETLQAAADELDVSTDELMKYFYKLTKLDIRHRAVSFGILKGLSEKDVENRWPYIYHNKLTNQDKDILQNPSSNKPLRKKEPETNLTHSEVIQVWFSKRKKIAELTFAEVHQIFQTSDSFGLAAKRLNLDKVILHKIVGNYIKIPSDKNVEDFIFNTLHTMTVLAGKKRFGDYYHQPLILSKPKITEKTLEQIHKIISKLSKDLVPAFLIKLVSSKIT